SSAGTASSARRFGETRGLQAKLHDRNIEPAVVLPGDLPLDADDHEAVARVEAERRRVRGGDAGEHRVVTVRAGAPDELREDQVAEPGPTVATLDVDGVLDGPRERGLGPIGRERAEGQHLGGRDGHDDRVAGGVTREPLALRARSRASLSRTTSSSAYRFRSMAYGRAGRFIREINCHYDFHQLFFETLWTSGSPGSRRSPRSRATARSRTPPVSST